jgi:hypothetical protein
MVHFYRHKYTIWAIVVYFTGTVAFIECVCVRVHLTQHLTFTKNQLSKMQHLTPFYLPRFLASPPSVQAAVHVTGACLSHQF